MRFSTIDPAREKRLGGLWSQYDTSADPAGNAAYLSAYAADTPQARNISQGNLGFLNKAVTGQYDPTEAYAQLLNLNQNALGTFLMNPALNELTRQRKAAQARGGYGGQGMGTYDALLQGRTLQQLASQAVPNLLGYTNQAYGTAGNLRQQDILNRLGIIGSGEQFRQLDVPALRYLEPTRLARSDLQANLGNLGALATQEDKNRAYYRQPGIMEKIGRGLNEIQAGTYSELNDALDLYSKAYGMGMGGGGGGGAGAGGLGGMMGGIGGAGGSSGGGGNQMQMIQQLLQMYGGRGAQQSPYASSPYAGQRSGLQYYESQPPWATAQ